MTINLSMPDRPRELKPRITVVGVGGAGGNAVNNMIRSNLSGVEFLVANTDAQSLEMSRAERRIQLGLGLTHGLGAGSRPDIGRAAAEEAIDEILEHLTGSHMVFITAGMGGGTGTGAAPVIARAAREQGVLTVGVVTRPFHFEGSHRMKLADSGLEELAKFVDTLIIIPNQNLFRIANEKTTFAQAFQLADDVLYSGVRGVTDLMVMPGLINLDFADIRTVMSEMGKAMMGTGEASGDKRAVDAAEAAISNPLLDDMSMKGARGVLINITGGLDMTLFEVDEAANRIRDEVDPDANIIFGATFDENLEGVMRVSVVATGIDAQLDLLPRQTEAAATTNAQARVMPFPIRPPQPNLRQGPAPVIARNPGSAQATAHAVQHEPVATAQQTEHQPGTAQAQPEQPAPLPRMPSFGQRTTGGMTGGATWGGTAPAPQHQAEDDATASDRPFIAPRPIQPTEPRQPVQSNRVAPRAAEPEEPRRSRLGFPGLIERMTGHARARQEPAPERQPERQLQQREPQHHEPAYQQPAAHYQPQPERRPERETAQREVAQRETAQPDAQKQLGGLDPADRLAVSRQEEDLLDIPAFLRRQAN
ncbi:cell division protein FtsZ [Constrictibacter sp. MBR-5]|jgi:cell division protein FtsZ|uniref:cell division protein FtsZ n=1 Tax=Constrictibacter sp. MBR-5 TaxID=3156467 RepID=UPI003392E385